jgi:hypothetical protein
VLAAAPPDVVLQLRAPAALAGAAALRAERLRAIAGPEANVEVSFAPPAGRRFAVGEGRSADV